MNRRRGGGDRRDQRRGDRKDDRRYDSRRDDNRRDDRPRFDKRDKHRDERENKRRDNRRDDRRRDDRRQDNRRQDDRRQPRYGAKDRFASIQKQRKNKQSGSNAPEVKQKKLEDVVRLNKFIARCGVSSRREADTLISAGKVKVNDALVTEMGLKINRHEDIVKVNGKQLVLEDFVYILLNKPKNMISTTSDPEGRKTVLDLLKHETDHRIFPVGRLDRNTTGLLLLTNDGDLTNKLTHPSFEIEKLYHVTTQAPITEDQIAKLKMGVLLEDGAY